MKQSRSGLGPVRARRISLLLLLLCACLNGSAQNLVTISGDVEDEFLGTALGGVLFSLHESDSTLMQDSLPCTAFTDRNRKLVKFEYRTAFSPKANGNYLIHASKDGYGDKWLSFTATAGETELVLPTIRMRREMQRTLDEVVVTATKVKMYYRGDTLVYDATAFKLPDGSMLDDLIRQMPGVTMNDAGEIFVNGRKVEELLLNSRSFMRGNKKVLMENLPYYTVSKLKVYEKASDESLALGHDVGGKKYVMDVNLKQEYSVGYIANVEAAGGTQERWLGRGFLLGFTDQWRYTLQANANNVNESRHVGQAGYWTPDRMPQSLATTRSVAGEADYASKKNNVKNTLSAEYSHVTTTTDMRQRQETFLEGMTPLSQTEMNRRDKTYNVGVHNFFTLLKPFYLTLQTDFTRTKADGTSASVFQQWGDTLTASQLTSTMDEQTETTVLATLNAVTSINKEKHRDVGADFLYMYYNNEVERASNYDVTQSSTREVSYNSDDVLNRTTEIRAGVSFRQRLNQRWRVEAKAGYTFRNTDAHDFLYHPDTLSLPSQLDMLVATTDPSNSYDYQYTKHRENLSLTLTNIVLKELMRGVTMNKERFVLTLEIPFLQQHLDYQRGAGSIIDTVARQHTVYFNPSARFKQQFGKDNRHEIHANASFRTDDLDLLQSIAYRDDSQPLIVRLGNTDLKARQTSHVQLGYANHNGPGKQEVSASIGFNYSHRDIAQSVSYDKQTGVYTYQPRNIHGGYNWTGTLNYSRDLDKKHYWSVQSNTTAALTHSVDYTMFSGDTVSRLNKVDTYTLEEKAWLQYHRNALNIRATGGVKWRYSNGDMSGENSLHVRDYQYGLSARYTIPRLNTTITLDGNVYSRRGYGSSELNSDDFVFNASLSQSILKGKLIARVEAFDLFHQLSNTQYQVNAQGRVETWYRSLPHYVMLHLVYHWNKNPKRQR